VFNFSVPVISLSQPNESFHGCREQGTPRRSKTLNLIRIGGIRGTYRWPKLLVVDDEPLVLETTAAMREELGCEVLTAATRSEAFTTIAQELHLAILITDINMPGMGGYELAERATRVRNGL
jgi:PleD family two-component response regulator